MIFQRALLREFASLAGAVFMAQVVEHLPPRTVYVTQAYDS